jgi:predicted dehydrogenase
VSIVLVGIGGYGEVYLSPLLDDPRGAGCEIVGAVDPRPENCSRLPEIEALGIPVFPTLEAFFDGGSADLAVISSPIHLHADHVCTALDHGSHVLVEKPAAAVTGDVDRMIAARDRAGRFVAVGFQWSFSDSIMAIKKDILSGRFGAPLGGRSLTLWPRTESYYGRNNWAGVSQDHEGRWILDSPASNAMAHHIHNLLFLLGPELDRSATPSSVSAQLARVNDIETFDTVAALIGIRGGVELLFLASHTIAESETTEPRFSLELEEASVEFPGSLEPMTARFRDGSVVEYSSPDATSQVEKLWACVGAVTKEMTLPCGLETARPHTSFIEAVEKSASPPHTFPRELLRFSDTGSGHLRWVEGLAAAFRESFATGEWPKLPGVHYPPRFQGLAP